MNSLPDHFGESINLDPEIKQDITRYLTQNAADYTEAKISVQILDSLDREVPLRVTTNSFVVKKHSDIQSAIFQRKSIRSIANCPACHLGVENTGSFKDRYVEIPDS